MLWTIQPARLLCPWGFSRQEYWRGLSFPPPGDLPNPEIEPMSPALQVDSLPSESPGKPKNTWVGSLYLLQGNLPDPGIEPGSLALQRDSLPADLTGKPTTVPQFLKKKKNLTVFDSNYSSHLSSIRLVGAEFKPWWCPWPRVYARACHTAVTCLPWRVWKMEAHCPQLDSGLSFSLGWVPLRWCKFFNSPLYCLFCRGTKMTSKDPLVQ